MGRMYLVSTFTVHNNQHQHDQSGLLILLESVAAFRFFSSCCGVASPSISAAALSVTNLCVGGLMTTTRPSHNGCRKEKASVMGAHRSMRWKSNQNFTFQEIVCCTFVDICASEQLLIRHHGVDLQPDPTTGKGG